MTSQIDATKPVIGNPTTESVRSNFAIASAEISDLQDMLDTLELQLGGYLPLIGGVMTGPLSLAGDPTSLMHAATKQYTDRKLALSGGIMTGPITLAGDATNDLHAVPLRQVQGYLPLNGGIMVGPITGLTANDGITVKSTAVVDQAFVFELKTGTADRASLTGNNVLLTTWNGIGFSPSVTGQRIPVGLSGVYLNARTGGLLNTGAFQARSGVVNDTHRFGALRILRDSSNNTIVGLTPGFYFVALDGTSPLANGGSNNAVNDRFYDAYDNIYTATAVDGSGAVTAIRMDLTIPSALATYPNPIALTPCPGFFGAGVAVNLVATLAPKLLIQVGAGQALELAASGGITLSNNTSVTGMLTTTTQVQAGTTMTSGSNTNAGALVINGPLNNAARALTFQTAGVNRWRVYMAINETTDAGCDFTIQRYNDAGTSLGTAWSINRGSGLITAYNGFATQNGTVTNPQDLSKHIQLYSGWGFSITSGRMNIVGTTYFVTAAGVDVGLVNAAGLNNFPIGQTTPAAGNFSSVRTGATNGPTWTSGAGAPAATAPIGSMYSRTDGTAGARLYVSAGGGTWTPVAAV